MDFKKFDLSYARGIIFRKVAPLMHKCCPRCGKLSFRSFQAYDSRTYPILIPGLSLLSQFKWPVQDFLLQNIKKKYNIH